MRKLAITRTRILDDVVEKSIEDKTQEVARKYQALHELSKDDIFVAPAVVSVDPVDEMLILERIHGIRSLREYYWGFFKGLIRDRDAMFLFERVGHALAWIHLKLSYAKSHEWKPGVRFLRAVQRYAMGNISCQEEDVVQLHCDYGFANVFIRERGRERDIVIIDPCGDGYSTDHTWCCGPRYVDLGKMLLSIEGKVPLRWQPRIHNRGVQILQNAFLKGYEEMSGKTLDRALCFSYAYAIGACYFHSRFPWLGRVALTVLYNRLWRSNFPLRAKAEQMVIVDDGN